MKRFIHNYGYLSTNFELFSNIFNFLLKFCKTRTEYIDAMKRDWINSFPPTEKVKTP
jgi:hypothetical protein